ncbi:hypothetical protein, partial [Clostridioides difficile]|uniref:hypothetical protein n=1 Tax=Clostridioides difficile TaxID=1496 RepID=UPI00115CCA08
PISINLADISLKLASVCNGIISLLILKTFSAVAFSASVATIFISNDLGVIGDACSINYRISDSDSSVRFKIIEKINGVKIA